MLQDAYNIKITRSNFEKMSTTNEKFQIFLQKIHKRQAKKAACQKVRPPHLIKWKIVMLQALQKLALHSHYDAVLLGRVSTLIRKLPEENFIQAIMNMQPLRPQFTSINYTKPESSISAPLSTKIKQVLPKVNFQQTSTTDTILKSIEEKSTARRTIEQQELLAHLINSQIMTHELSAPNHPFTKIIQGIAILLQNKYKVWIPNEEEKKGTIKMEKLCKVLRQDIKMVEQFFQMASQPIVDTLSVNGMRDKNIERSIASFIISFLRNNKKIFEVLRKILRYAAKRSQEQSLFEVHCPQQANIDHFEVPPSLQIQGCYVYTINKIIQFINSSSPQESLIRLAEIRDTFYQDIAEYLKANGGECQKVNGQSQLEIFKFLVSKLRIFSGDLLAELKLLEVIYGQEQMGFCYDVSSYIHSQLSIVLEAIRQHL